MINLQHKTILITGASSGIGRATAILFSRLGAQVILSARNEDMLNETRSLMQDQERHRILVADLSQPEGVAQLVAGSPALDGLVHCCGKVLPVPAKFIKESQLQDVFSVNYFSAVHTVSGLLKQKKLNTSASVVFISSVSTLHAYFGGGPYISSKSALEGYAKTLALELIPKKIRVNVLQPALVRTAIFESTVDASVNEAEMDRLRSQYPLGVGEPEDIAQALAYFISDASKWVTGSFLKMDGGLTLGFN